VVLPGPVVEVVRRHEPGDLEPGVRERSTHLADGVLVEVAGVLRRAANRLVGVAPDEHPEPLGERRRVRGLDHEAAARGQPAGEEPKHGHERNVQVLDDLPADDDVVGVELGIVRVVEVELGVVLPLTAREAMVLPAQGVDLRSWERLAQQGALEAGPNDEDPLRREPRDEVEQQLVASRVRSEVDLLFRRVDVVRQRQLRVREARRADTAR
jgi:hypothetical protein